MLRKLLGYEMKEMGKILLPLCIAILIVSVCLALNIRWMSGASQITVFLSILLMALTVASGVVFFVIVLQRFWKNLMGNEGYLMFTLPATTNQHIISKALASIFWLFIGFMVILSSAVIVYRLSVPMVEKSLIKMITQYFSQELQPDVRQMIGWGILVSVCSLYMSVFHLYACIAIGHQWTNHQILGGIIAYIVTMILQNNILSRLIVFVFRGDAGQLTQSFSPVALPTCIFFLIAGTIYYLACWLLLENRLNLE